MEKELELEPKRTPEDGWGLYYMRPLFDLDYSPGCSNPLCIREMMFPMRNTHPVMLRTPLLCCTKCKQTYYCHKDCQAVAYPKFHKDNCGFLGDLVQARQFLLGLLIHPENSQLRAIVEKIITVGMI